MKTIKRKLFPCKRSVTGCNMNTRWYFMHYKTRNGPILHDGGKSHQSLQSLKLQQFSVSPSRSVSPQVDIPQTHITGSESLHPTVPTLWCHKHTGWKVWNGKGCCGKWVVAEYEWAWVQHSTEEWSQRCSLGNHPRYMSIISYFFKRLLTDGESPLRKKVNACTYKGWWVDRSISNRHY